MNVREMMLSVVIIIHGDDDSIKHCQYGHGSFFCKDNILFETTQGFIVWGYKDAVPSALLFGDSDHHLFVNFSKQIFGGDFTMNPGGS